MELTLLDGTIVAGYFGLTLAVGLLFGRRAGRSVTEFFLSGRRLPWWIAGTSMVATTFAADTPLAVTNLMFRHGLAGNWWWWAFVPGGMITVFVYAALWRRAEVLTDVELVELRYAGRPAAFVRGFRALYVALLINPIIIGWVTKAMLTVLKETVLYGRDRGPLWNDGTIVAVCLGVVLVYAAVSGLWGVVITDFLQFIMAMGGCVALAVIAVGEVGGIDAMQAHAAALFEEGNQAFRFFPDFGAADPWMPLHLFLILLFVQWWASWYPGAEPGGGGFIVQRMASCKNERHAVGATLWFQVAHFCVRPWPWFLIAFAAMVLYPELHEAARRDPTFDAGVGFPRVIRDLAPAGLRGLMLVAFLAAFMSTISTQINWGSSYLVNDFYCRFVRPKATPKELARISRLATVLMLALGGLAAWLMRNRSIDDAWKLLVALGAGTGAVFMLRWFWWRISAWTEIAAMIGSLFFFVAVTGIAASTDIALAGEETMAIVAGLTIALWLAVTYLTPPEAPETLERFYRKVRPAGPGWGPVAQRAPEVRPEESLARGLVAASCGTGLVFFALPAVGWLIFGHYLAGLLCGAGALACGAAVLFVVRDRSVPSARPAQASGEQGEG